MSKAYKILYKIVPSLLLPIIIFLVFSKFQMNTEKTWDEMNASKEVSKEAFNDAKFGMFIHWGLYSIPGGIWKDKKIEDYGRPPVAEWIQCTAKIPRDEYAELATQFNPVNFDADAIAKLAESSEFLRVAMDKAGISGSDAVDFIELAVNQAVSGGSLVSLCLIAISSLCV